MKKERNQKEKRSFLYIKPIELSLRRATHTLNERLPPDRVS